MVEHLHLKVGKICAMVDLKPEDLIIDIGSNDSTLLQGYPKKVFTLVGIDPTGKKFKDYYPDHIRLIPEFFSAKAVKSNLGDKKAKVISSIAMFYDLESPIDFMQQIYDVLADDGVWVFEQSYTYYAGNECLRYNLPEHLEYYGLKQIKWMADRWGSRSLMWN
jgi:NDP-4-keto-2,6-dideoxyhexose 3-C-methyltransferase